MLRKPKECGGCSLESISAGFSIPEGECNNGLLIVGESLGEKELSDGLPFRPYAEAGSVLQNCFRRLSLNRNDFLLWNLICCQPPYNKLEGTSYEYSSISHCKINYFDRVMEHYKGKIKCILALGNLPLRHLVPDIDSLFKQAKEEKNKDLIKKLGISSLRGYKFNSIYGMPLVASFHPSFVNRTGRIYSGVLLRDLYHALQIAKGNEKEFKTDYILNPTIEDAEKFYNYCKNNPEKAIAYDIETPHSIKETDESEIEYKNIEVRDINSIQFSIEEGKGIFLEWRDEYIEIAKRILALPNDKISWNGWEFDNTHLRYHLGKDVINGLLIDSMWQWKHANPDFVKIGRALQFAANFYAPEFPAWKHISESNPKQYGVLDVDSLKRINNGLTKDLSSKRLFDNTKSLQEGFLDDIVKLHPILKDIENRGLPIDVKARDIFRTQLEVEIVKTMEALQELYPFSLRNITPREGYKNEPKEVAELTKAFNDRVSPNGDSSYFIFDDESIKESYLKRFIERNSRKSTEETEEGKKDTKDTTGLIKRGFLIDGLAENRWCRVELFKPGSRDQVIKYIKFKKYRVPKKKDRIKGDQETTTKDEIAQLAENHPEDGLLLNIILCRELRKMLSTYVPTKKRKKSKSTGWVLSPDNRIHASFNFIPATGQLSSVIHNAPARGTRFSSPGYRELAKQFRRTIAASSGKVILSADWSSFHALTLGFEAEDPLYMRLVRADVHSYVAAWILTNELPRKLVSMKRKVPLKDRTKWVEKCELYEEAILRLQSINDWINYSDDKLKEELKWIKSNFKFTRDSQAKPAILGMGFGLEVHKFYKMNRYSFASKEEPQRILDLIRKLFPKTFIDYPERILKLADNQTYLLTRYGYIRRFYDVYDYRLIKEPRTLRMGETQYQDKQNRWWIKKKGTSANEAIAFMPSNDAFGVKKEKMRELWNHPAGNIIQRANLINEIHDDLMFEINESDLTELVPIIKSVMESPAKFLKNSTAPNGLITKVELKCGPNWGSIQTLNI